MATAKKAPAKKPAKKTTKKSAAKAPAKKTAVTKKEVATKTTKTTRASRAPLTPMQKLRSINLSAAFTAVVFAILTVIFVSPASAELLLSVQARDSFANLDSVVLGSANEVLMSIEYRYILVAALLVGAVGSLLMATKLRGRYEASVGANVSGMRWLFMGVSAAITLQFVSFLGGVQDAATLKAIAGLIIATTLFGWLSDRENAVSKSPKWVAYGASVFTGVLAWTPLLGSLVGTSLFSDERFGWHVYAIAGVTLAGFIGFALTQLSSIKKKNQFEYTVFEQRYLRIDQITKLLIVVVLISAIQK